MDEELKNIKKLITLMEKHDLSHVSVESQGTKIKLNRGANIEAIPAALAPAAPAPPPQAAAPAPDAAAAAPAAPTGPEITAPMVGTFYSAESPESDPFVKVGAKVDEDTVVCIIEAMKVMNEIKAETKGTITEVLVDNASPVQFGEPLFRIEPA
ncbi:MAG: acetyl-CoA carboxylase biotin carboxyl carrier protein [Verrucomicrobiota bacterium]